MCKCSANRSAFHYMHVNAIHPATQLPTHVHTHRGCFECAAVWALGALNEKHAGRGHVSEVCPLVEKKTC